MRRGAPRPAGWAAASLGRDRQPARGPAAPAAVERDGVRVAHLLQVVAHERAAESAAAVADDRRVLLRDRLFDVALDRALAHVVRTGQMALLPLVVFARVEQHEALAGAQTLDALVDGVLAHARLRVLHECEEPRRMVVRHHATAGASSSLASRGYSRTVR